MKKLSSQVRATPGTGISSILPCSLGPRSQKAYPKLRKCRDATFWWQSDITLQKSMSHGRYCCGHLWKTQAATLCNIFYFLSCELSNHGLAFLPSLIDKTLYYVSKTFAFLYIVFFPSFPLQVEDYKSVSFTLPLVFFSKSCVRMKKLTTSGWFSRLSTWLLIPAQVISQGCEIEPLIRLDTQHESAWNSLSRSPFPLPLLTCTLSLSLKINK